MSPTWKLTKLEDITTKIGSGATPRGGKSSYKESGISLIRSQNVYDLYFDETDLAFIDKKQADKLANVIVEKNDVLLNITGASVARCCIVPTKLLPARVNQHVSIVRANPRLLNPHFLQYCLVSQQYKHHLLTLAQGGATREALTKRTIENFEIPLPPLDVQNKITAVLSAYDDLIENNTHRIAILEEMAQRLYREWFVHFRFPGHEGVALVAVEGKGVGGNGRLPEGWQVVSFSEIADVLSGGTPKTKVPKYWNGDIPFFSPKDHNGSFFIAETERYVTRLGVDNCSSHLYPPNTVFITARGTVGKVIMPSVDMAMNQSCYALKGKNGIHQYFVFLTIINHVEQLKQRAHGAVFDTIIMDTFTRLQTVKPPDEILHDFVRIIEPIFKLIRNLLNKNTNLRQTRDLLLPRLISGQLDLINMYKLAK